MTQVKKTKKPSNTDQILSELKHLNDQVDDLRDYIEKTVSKQRKRKVTSGLLNGFFNAVGIVAGTLFVTFLLVYFGQLFIKSDSFQNWISNQLSGIVKDALPEALQSF